MLPRRLITFDLHSSELPVNFSARQVNCSCSSNPRSIFALCAAIRALMTLSAFLRLDNDLQFVNINIFQSSLVASTKGSTTLEEQPVVASFQLNL